MAFQFVLDFELNVILDLLEEIQGRSLGLMGDLVNAFFIKSSFALIHIVWSISWDKVIKIFRFRIIKSKTQVIGNKFFSKVNKSAKL